MFDVVAAGELLIDFTPGGKSEAGNDLFEMNPGGAPANCLAALCALKGKAAFIGKVGCDQFGDFLTACLADRGIDIQGVSRTDAANTTLAFVHLKESGERSFTFLRHPGADTRLTTDDIPLDVIDRCKIFHFGSLSLTDEPARLAVLYAAAYAKKKGKIISYDPNYRPLLWKNEDEAVTWMQKGMEYAHIVKMSEEELFLITGCADMQKAAQELVAKGVGMLFVTMGASGAYYCTKNESGSVAGFSVQAVDTTGCGDAFTGAMLYKLCQRKDETLREMVRFANAAGALCATKKGGIPAMPSMDEIRRLMRDQ